MKGNNFYHYNYFYHMRSGWVHKNFLTGQGTANSTRDYLRVLIFLVGNTATVAALVLGYASILFDESAPTDRMLLIKLCMCGVIFSIMFFMFIFATRYAVQFHFLMNTDKDCHGVPMNKNVIITVFHRSHLYYGAGIRLYNCVIPLFAWALSSWALLGVCPFYVLLMRDYDNNQYVEDELEVMYKDTEFGRYKQVSSKEDKKGVGNGYMRQETLNEPQLEIAMQPASAHSQQEKL
eukprot:CAMPEP_0114419256 /NCGR_PEP_ID=MMETSP0103-20121206/3930_1 /TAXON_ID=37642 ORGANISM="Paraphysomonas imperforata, Strain PA2" /NCGR_SAMPLE_ID=MMETSP0103 /ASSEMBLY_ACC=CAM_ASM_000201 /LENGTH=234 /DNA_ID=CAMNT_0001587663 /DNA_START=169 /DNA_END=873 /DNA_ORIENTATION=-